MMKPIISLTTIPERVAHIEPCLASLDNQGPDVHLFIALRNQRIGSQFDSLPNFVDKYCFVHCIVGSDLGPATKLIPALRRGYERVITADDDRIYAEGWADKLLEAADRLTGTAIAFCGRRLTKSKTYSDGEKIVDVKEDTSVDILTGCMGTYYERAMFADDFLENYSFSGRKSDPANNDDLLVSDHLWSNSIPMIVPADLSSSMIREDKRIKEIKPLLENNRRRGMNDEYIKDLFQ